MNKVKVAIIGSGNIGADLMVKVLWLSQHLQMGAMVGIDPASDGPTRAKRMGLPTVSAGVDGLIAPDGFDGLDTRDILVEVGRRGLVGGHEDMIVDIALDLAGRTGAQSHQVPA